MALEKLPFNKEGDMLEWVGGGYYEATEWKDNTPFKASMMIIDWERGRSAVRVIVQDIETGIKYPMFMKDFFNMVVNLTIQNGGVIYGGNWIGVKRGANYGIKVEGL